MSPTHLHIFSTSEKRVEILSASIVTSAQNLYD